MIEILNPLAWPSIDSSEEDAAPAEPVPLNPLGVWRSDGGEVGMDLDIWKMRSQTSDSLPGDQLTVVPAVKELKEIQKIICFQNPNGFIRLYEKLADDYLVSGSM